MVKSNTHKYPLQTRGDGHEGNEGIDDGHTTPPCDKEKSTHEVHDMESTDHQENRKTSHVEREVCNDTSGKEECNDDSGQSDNGESGVVRVHAENSDSEENNGQTMEKGSELVDSDGGGHEALCTEQINPPNDIKINFDPRDDCDQNSSSNLKTKHAACISKIVGITEKVLKFDELRYQLKLRKNPTVTQKQEQNKLLAELQILIQSEKSKIMNGANKTSRRSIFSNTCNNSYG